MRYNRLGSVAQLDVDTLGRAQELPGEGGGGRAEGLMVNGLVVQEEQKYKSNPKNNFETTYSISS